MQLVVYVNCSLTIGDWLYFEKLLDERITRWAIFFKIYISCGISPVALLTGYLDFKEIFLQMKKPSQKLINQFYHGQILAGTVRVASFPL